MAYFIRELQTEDCLTVIDLLNQLDGESNFSIYAAGERKLNAFQLATAMAMGGQILFGAESATKLVGCLMLFRDKSSRVAHNAILSVGVLASQQGQGIGKALLAQAEDWAKLNDVRRLELSVAANNERALQIYSKLGYVVEGTKRGALLLDEVYTDEFVMAKAIS